MRFAKLWSSLAYAAAIAGLTVGVGSASANLVTGFESPGYSTGAIAGQNGWTVNSDAAFYNTFTVSNSAPLNGSQSVLMSDVSPYNSAHPYGPQLISPNTGTGTSSTLTSFNFKITEAPSSSPAAVHNIYLVSDASADVDPMFGQNVYVGGISLQADGRILAEEYYPDFGGFMSLTDTGATWTPNAVHSFSIKVDTTGVGDMTYTYDGSAIAETRLAVASGYEQYVGNVLFRNDDSSIAGESASIDNFSVTAVPEPASLGCLGVAGLFLARRRRPPAITRVRHIPA